MCASFLKHCLQKKDRCFRRIYQFNLDLVGYLHEDWIGDYFPHVSRSLFALLVKHPRSRRQLSEILRHRLNVHDFPDFEQPPQRLALLDPEPLCKVLFYVGIALHAPFISHQVQRTKVLALRSGLGNEGYLFALKRAPFLLDLKAFPAMKFEDFSDLPSLLSRRALICLKIHLQDAPPSVYRRMVLKLPKSFTQSDEEDTLLPSQWDRAKVELLFKKVLLQEVDATWAPYFS